MRVKRLFAAMVSLAALLWWVPASAQPDNNDLRRILGSVQTIQLFALGPLVFQDADTAILEGLTIQLFGIDAPDIDERCIAAVTNGTPCGVLALATVLEVIDQVTRLDCVINEIDEGIIFATCVSEDIDDDTADRQSFSLGETLILRGYARADEDVDDARVARLMVAELEAQQTFAGFWDCDGPAPRSWSTDKNRLCDN